LLPPGQLKRASGTRPIHVQSPLPRTCLAKQTAGTQRPPCGNCAWVATKCRARLHRTCVVNACGRALQHPVPYHRLGVSTRTLRPRAAPRCPVKDWLPTTIEQTGCVWGIASAPDVSHKRVILRRCPARTAAMTPRRLPQQTNTRVRLRQAISPRRCQHLASQLIREPLACQHVGRHTTPRARQAEGTGGAPIQQRVSNKQVKFNFTSARLGCPMYVFFVFVNPCRRPNK